MEIKQLEPMDKVLTFFGEFKSATVESTIKGIVKHSSRGHLHREDYVNGGGALSPMVPRCARPIGTPLS